MNLKELVTDACNKELFIKLALNYLEFIKTNLQAVIVSRNENHYQFFQYKQEGTYNVTRPINSNLMYSFEEFERESKDFLTILSDIRGSDSKANREIVNRTIYTAQQCIGAALDALPAKKSNTARKINGDLFERFIRLIISEIGVSVTEGTISVPVKLDGEMAFKMNYQHDLIVQVDSETKAIGSVKTSSKDRIDKIFIDKFLYNKLTDTDIPHFAIFLNDVQRKGKEGKYGINSTFLTGHFKGYTVKLNPLDGVYYCDIRPNMITEQILKNYIKTFDNFVFTDVWEFLK
ncbi:MAG: hypothetical protein GDA44_07090 [Prochloron sp. SP5CPC1]|nr:hypothetical protein [Candidatus Paraprochloron terpiosi SP5CPC1]